MEYSQDIIDSIADTNYDNTEWVELVLNDERLLAIVVDNLEHKHIMVYYHCYEIADNASKLNPLIFYKYWDRFVNMLYHKNSYHRNIGLTMISHLVTIDTENKFNNIINVYFQLLYDKKYLTSLYCIRCMKYIVTSTNLYSEKIELAILDFKCPVYFNKKQYALMLYDIIDLLYTLFPSSKNKNKIFEIISKQKDSISPKTRKYASTLLKTFK